MFVEAPAREGGQSGNNKKPNLSNNSRTCEYINFLKPNWRNNEDEIPILQLNLAYERDRGRRARIKEFLFKATINGGDGDGRH